MYLNKKQQSSESTSTEDSRFKRPKNHGKTSRKNKSYVPSIYSTMSVYKLKSQKQKLRQKRMATHLQNKISIDVSAELSYESLSFSTLLSAKDLESKSPPTNSAIRVKNQNQEFLTRTAPALASLSSNKDCPEDMSISNTKRQLQALLNQPEQTKVTNELSSKKATHGNSKTSSDYNTEVSDKPTRKERNQTKKERAASSSSFVQKIFRSFVSPCRECHAHKPTVKSMPAEPIKLR